MRDSIIQPGNKRIRRGQRRVLVALVAALSVSQIFPGLVHAAAGDLDPTFGSGGKVTTEISGLTDQAYDIAVQADGRVIAAGATQGSSGFDFAVVRYNTNGSLDASFGAGGRVTTDFFGIEDGANAMALQSDGRIVVAGQALRGSSLTESEFALARYNPDGSLDSTFGTGGKVTTDFFGGEDRAFAVAIQSDGKIVAAGGAFQAGIGKSFAIARYNTNGSLDASFGAGGKVTNDFGGSDEAADIAIQPDGKIVAAGTTGLEFAIARYNTNGSLDPTFGTGGLATTGFSSFGNDFIEGVALQGDGKIVVVGRTERNLFSVVRYNTNGSLDVTFGSGGRGTTESGAIALDVAIQSDGKIVAVGEGSGGIFLVARYNTNGSFDSTFGEGGRVTTDFLIGRAHRALAVAIQSDDKIIAAGFASLSIGSDFALVRYLGDPPPCSITCPSNIAVSNGPGQCGAIVNYSAPTGVGCGPVACIPPPGSFFPIGTTTLTCEPAAGTACSFNITVVDTQPPAIICPPNVTAVAPAGGTSAVVTFTAPSTTDNCSGVSTTCSPSSGSSFPLGASTVTCTASDASGNMATCFFTVTVFDVCLQDDSNAQTVLLFNSQTGDYRFCGSGTTFTGRGTASRRGGVVTLEHNATDRRVTGRGDQSVNTGTAALQSPPGSTRCTITDRDTRNNTCSCR